MLNIQELANFITEKLNIISTTQNASYVFDIYAEVGKGKDDSSIKGVIKSLSNNPLVIKSLASVKTIYRVELSIPNGMSNKNLVKIEDIINEFVKTYEGTQQTFTGGVGSFDLTYAHLPENYTIKNEVGGIVPLQFELTVNFTDNGLLGSSKIWLLNGVEIPYLNEVILLNKEGQTNRISKEKYNKTIVLAQTKYYKFTIPFDKTNTVCTSLQADLLNGDFSKTYTLSYYDGVTYTQENPFTTTVSLFQSGDSGSDGGTISKFTVTFADVSATEEAPEYTLELFSTPFDENNERFFDGVQEQTEWYDALPVKAPAVQIKAPNLNTISNTTQVYDYSGTNFTPVQLANMNVARINEKKNEQSYSIYKLEEGRLEKHLGTIIGGNETINYSVIDTTPVTINGVIYFLSINNDIYSLRDGGGNQIPITNNTFELGEYYHLVESDNYYSIIDSQNNILAQISKDTAHPQIFQSNIELGSHNDWELLGVWNNELNRYNFTLTRQSDEISLTYRTLTRSNEDYYTQYWWVEGTPNGYNVGLFSGRPGLSDFDWTGLSIGDLITQFHDEDLYLASPTQIVGSGGTVIDLSSTLPMYYQFKVENSQYYLDNADLQGAINDSDITIYDDTYSLVESISYTGASAAFTINNEQYIFIVNENAMLITKQGFIFADITNTRLFTIGTDYVLTESQVDIENILLVKQGTQIIARCQDNTTYDYSFIIQGIVYYVNKNESNKYDIYYASGAELVANVAENEDFAIPNGEFNHYYYTIVSSEIGANNQIILTLRLNTFQTYVINPQLQFSDCFINKAHLNRFIDNGDGTVSFNGGVESLLFEREEMQNVAKRLVAREVLKYNYGANSSTLIGERKKRFERVEGWLQNNVYGWLYAFFPAGKMSVYVTDSNAESPPTVQREFKTQKYMNYMNSTVESNFIIFACPLYKKDKAIYLNAKGARWADGGIDAMLKLDKDAFMNYLQNTLTTSGDAQPLAYGLKFSTKPPIADIVGTLQKFDVDVNGDLVSLRNQTTLDQSVIKVGTFWGIRSDKTIAEAAIDDDGLPISIYFINGCLVCETPFNPTIELEDYIIINPTKFPKKNTNYIDKVFYRLNRYDFTQSVPQTFELLRPGVNVENIGIHLEWEHFTPISYYTSYTTTNDYIGQYVLWFDTEKLVLVNSSNKDNLGIIPGATPAYRPVPRSVNWSVENQKGLYNLDSNRYSLEIKESSMIFKILQTPQIFSSNDYFSLLEFKERVYGVVGANKSPLFNPKLLNSDYRSLRLTNERGGEFEYDIQKLNTETLQTAVTEQITPDLQRSYFRAINTDGVYQQDCSQNLTGLVDSSEMSMPLASDYVRKMLAEQPNYFNERRLENARKIVGGILGGALGGGSSIGLKGGPAGVALGAVVGGGAVALDVAINNKFTDDNMSKQSAQIQNANGNVIFNLSYTTPGMTIEQYALLPQEERIINDQMFANGYTYNRIDQIRNFMHTRKYFNTITAMIETMSGLPLSNEVRDDIKQRFANGIRLWHTDEIQYEKENYELWLEE